jgi:hypothetical protein
MAGNVQTLAAGVADAAQVPAVTKISPNSRTMAMGLPTIAQSSIGACFSAVGAPTGPMTVKVGDPRVSAQ